MGLGGVELWHSRRQADELDAQRRRYLALLRSRPVEAAGE
jgi:hypothetical protein